MERVFIHGKMAENMMVSTIMIRNMGMAFIFGLMVAVTKENGSMENSNFIILELFILVLIL